ncbi:S-layer homology domain-containing protein [Arthrobacter sp. AK01]|uniref:S-layer homology domain-containing protein n=1 Tax=Micrococcaceae TaxID=1268 RepID=UPI001E29F9FD|nr:MULTISPECIES: S-layer homology domain-containing protein [Micrococcaceae]MCD4851263.1 S-layer homology domain-containing protein [Arthrobacter sp. AK01]MCP1411454.1 hypothetical protein [Paenarthrobacter sp. A20]
MSFLRIRRWRVAVLAMMATLLASLVLGMVPAHAIGSGPGAVRVDTLSSTTGGSISGTISVRSGVDLGEVAVWAINLYNPSSTVPMGTVNLDGTYTIPGVPAGEYKIYFHSSQAAWFPEEIYGGSNFDTFVPVLVNEGQSVTGIDLRMGGGRIQGRVDMPFHVDTNTVKVEAIDASGGVAASEYPDSTGNYDLRGLPSGDYKIRVTGGVLPAWYGGGASFAEAETVSITGEQDVWNATMTADAGASISGYVDGPWPSAGTISHQISVWDLDGNVVKEIIVGQTGTSYTVSGLAPGQYKLGLDIFTGRRAFEGQFYSGVLEHEGADAAQVITLAGNEEKTRFDFTATNGGTITGTLRDQQAHPLPFSVVEAYTRDSSLSTRKAVTDAQGRYEITGLTTGSYRLRGNTTNVRLAGTTFSGNVAEEPEAKEIAVTSGAQTSADLTYWSPTRFADIVEGQPFDHQISWMASTGISKGWPDATYRPFLPVNRDAMAAFLYRLAGQPAFSPPASSPFVDVPTTSQFYKEIAWLASTKISGGWPDQTFRPLQPVNRDAMAAFLYRFSKVTDFVPPAASPFVDVPANAQFYKEIAWLASTEISTGWDDRTFRPLTPVNRDAMAAFMYRFNAQDS